MVHHLEERHLEERPLDQDFRLVVRQGREEGLHLEVARQVRRQLHLEGGEPGHLWGLRGMAWGHHPDSGRGKLVKHPEPQGLPDFEAMVRVQAQGGERQVPLLEQAKELKLVPPGRELARQAWVQQVQAQGRVLRRKEPADLVRPHHQLVPGRVQELPAHLRLRV